LPNEPGIPLDDLLKPALQIEAELRNLFATEKSHERLAEVHVGLVDVFDAPDTIRATRARIFKDDLSARCIIPLTDERRRLDGPCNMLDNISDFKKNWRIEQIGVPSSIQNLTRRKFMPLPMGCSLATLLTTRYTPESI
jgi:hypothetical protein